MPHLTESMDRIEIYTSKKKSILILLGSVVFVTLGIFSTINPERFVTILFRHPELIRLIGIASILFFGFGIFVGIKRLIKSEIALIIDAKGLNINPKKSLTEFIEWKDILGFKELKIQSQRIIIIGVKNPEHWIEKETSAIRKKLMRFNLNNYDSPFNITAAGLDISFDELNKKLKRYLKKYINEAQSSRWPVSR
jgi:hypothetical protein